MLYRWAGVALATAAMVTGAAVGAHSSPSSVDPHLAAAMREANGLLATFVPPPGSHNLGELPDPPPRFLAGPPEEGLGYADAIVWYSTPATPDEVLAWMEAHPPRGST